MKLVSGPLQSFVQRRLFRPFSRFRCRFVSRQFESGPISEVANHYSALPSMHVGWAVLSAVALGSLCRGGWRTGVVVGYPLLVTIVVMGLSTFLVGLLPTYEANHEYVLSADVVKRIKQGIDANQWSMLFLIRLVPAVPFFLANLIPAFLDVPLRRFVISTFFGIIPGGVVYTSVGAGLGEVFARGETPDLGVIFEPHILMPILGLVALAALPIAIKALRGGKAL